MIITLDALLEAVRAGTGAQVVVEGQTERDDPWYYRRWFGALGSEVSFIHYDGCTRVKRAVAYLREREPGRPIFGIVDRDFTTADETDADDPLEPSLFRTGLYTLENYFLADIVPYSQILDILTAGHPPPGWASPEDIRARIQDAYRISLPVAAWNRVVHDECRRTGSRADSPKFHIHHNAVTDQALDALDQWGRSRAAPMSLRDIYANNLARLSAAPDTWPEQVTGKAVFVRFAEKFPELRSDLKLRRLYIGQQPPPPPDLAAIVDRIRLAAAKLRRPGA